MLSTALYSYSSYIGAKLNHLDPHDTPFYDFSQPRIKSILLNNYDWILSTYKDGRMRDAVLDNVLKTIICRTPYLGYDEFECPECGDWILIYRHCHSRFCTRCGGYYEYKDTYNPERKTCDRQYMLECVTETRRLRPPGIYED